MFRVGEPSTLRRVVATSRGLVRPSVYIYIYVLAAILIIFFSAFDIPPPPPFPLEKVC